MGCSWSRAKVAIDLHEIHGARSEHSSQGAGYLLPSQTNSTVKVAVVIRPLLPQEKSKAGTDCVEVLDGRVIRLPQHNFTSGGTPQIDPQKLSFEYDKAYRGTGSGRNLFEEMTVPLLKRFLEGFNATVFAYGQTGSGKTFTMGTAAGASQICSLQEDSIIPRALKLVLDAVATSQRDYTSTLKASYVQIHEDSIKDLLVDSTTPRATRIPSITLRESPTKGVYLDNVKEIDVKALSDVAVALEEGNSRRAVAAHNLNEVSSRSHAILQLTLEQERRPNAPPDPTKHKLLSSKLNLVDLAGSERAKETGTSGQQFNEGVQINKGLLALGNVIAALTQGSTRKHVPYRDSKLTRILQDSLGGSSETLMIACVSPASFNLEQTINTLRYASRARSIQNRLQMHIHMSPEKEIAFLKKTLAALENTLAEKEALIQRLQAPRTKK